MVYCFSYNILWQRRLTLCVFFMSHYFFENSEGFTWNPQQSLLPWHPSYLVQHNTASTPKNLSWYLKAKRHVTRDGWISWFFFFEALPPLQSHCVSGGKNPKVWQTVTLEGLIGKMAKGKNLTTSLIVVAKFFKKHTKSDNYCGISSQLI